MISTIVFWVVVALIGIMATLVPILYALGYFLGETEKERGERVYREYTKWQEKRAEDGA